MLRFDGGVEEETALDPRGFAVWCVTVRHPDHLLLVRRVLKRSKEGAVLAASTPVVAGNCQTPSSSPVKARLREAAVDGKEAAPLLKRKSDRPRKNPTEPPSEAQKRKADRYAASAAAKKQRLEPEPTPAEPSRLSPPFPRSVAVVSPSPSLQIPPPAPASAQPLRPGSIPKVRPVQKPQLFHRTSLPLTASTASQSSVDVHLRLRSSDSGLRLLSLARPPLPFTSRTPLSAQRRRWASRTATPS